jgi:4-diphosphocytidyl-2-C-methyl-D-erythritol kinase
MLIERRGGAVVVWAPAKVNLFLEILSKRNDGYHEIATLMVAVSLFDTLEFIELSDPVLRVDCDEPRLSAGPDNLVYRAADLLRGRSQESRGVAIRLRKRIPLAAGLAGGSSDAAAVLVGLNLLWQLGKTHQELSVLGAELGSDVAFFLGGPASWCTGRGEQVSPVQLGRELWLVLACLPLGLATAEVYARVRVPGSPEKGEEIRRAATEGRIEELGRLLHNRLQGVAEEMCPGISQLRRRLEQLQPAGQLMSGSGPTVFALCRDQEDASRIAHELQHGRREETSPNVFLVRSCFELATDIKETSCGDHRSPH